MSSQVFERSHLKNIQGYQASKSLPYSDRIIKLNSNENPYPPSPQVLKVLQNFNTEYLRRYPDPHGQEFRATIGTLLNISPEWICVGNGADHLLELIFRGFIDPQDKVVYPTPTYSLYEVLAHLEAANALSLDFDTDNPIPLQNILHEQGKVTLIASPASPTGHAIPNSILETLAQELEGLLVIDEAYFDFAEETALSLVQRHPNVILVRTLSKGYSLAGVRLGYAIAHPDIIAVLNKVKDTYSVDAITLQIGVAAIQDQAYKDEKIALIKRSRQKLSTALQNLDWDVTPSATNFLWAKPTQDAANLSAQLKAQQIYIRHYPDRKLRNHVRITVGTEAQNQKLLQVIQSIL